MVPSKGYKDTYYTKILHVYWGDLENLFCKNMLEQKSKAEEIYLVVVSCCFISLETVRTGGDLGGAVTGLRLLALTPGC